MTANLPDGVRAQEWPKKFTVETPAGDVTVTVYEDGSIEVKSAGGVYVYAPGQAPEGYGSGISIGKRAKATGPMRVALGKGSRAR